MYYQVALQKTDEPPIWQWKSTPLSSLNALVQWLVVYRAFPRDRLRIFYSSSRAGLQEQLQRESEGLPSTSAPATQFLKATPTTPKRPSEAAPRVAGESSWQPTTRALALDQVSSTSPLEQRREELERGAGGDHDVPYIFSLPISTPEVLAWVRLMVRVQHGDLRSEVVAVGADARSGESESDNRAA